MTTAAPGTGITAASAWNVNGMVPEAVLNADVPTLLEDLRGISTKGPLSCSKAQAAYQLWNYTFRSDKMKVAVFEGGGVPALLKLAGEALREEAERHTADQTRYHALGCLNCILSKVVEARHEIAKVNGMSVLKSCLESTRPSVQVIQ